ncbi:MAG: N-acetylmuramoyl-L-alanine amidase, partial [Firmicutes bacterium]|nr:N-acetylmuramoyl-L-alanine amidase [Bacillota bacterium]
MSNSKLVKYTRLSPNKTSPRNHKIDTITPHVVVGQFTAKKILDMQHFVTYDGRKGSSCNYAIGKDGSIGLGVDEQDRSWCSSSASNDHRAITIEIAS